MTTNRPKGAAMPEPTYYLATVRGQADVLVWGPDRGDWYMTSERIADGGWCGHAAKFVTDLRPVVLLDPGALPSVSDLRAAADMAREVAHLPWGILDYLADLIEAQTTAPVEEPTNLAVRVGDKAGREWAQRKADGRWRCLTESYKSLTWAEFIEAFGPVEVIA